MKTETNKLTSDLIIELEAESLRDAIGGCLELNDAFLDSYCSEALRKVLEPIPEPEREFHLESFIGAWRVLSGFDGGSDINLPIGEIEFQFDGEPEEVFEDPSEFHIREGSDLAYLAIDGICFDVDCEGLRKAYREWIEE